MPVATMRGFFQRSRWLIPSQPPSSFSSLASPSLYRSAFSVLPSSLTSSVPLSSAFSKRCFANPAEPSQSRLRRRHQRGSRDSPKTGASNEVDKRVDRKKRNKKAWKGSDSSPSISVSTLASASHARTLTHSKYAHLSQHEILSSVSTSLSSFSNSSSDDDTDANFADDNSSHEIRALHGRSSAALQLAEIADALHHLSLLRQRRRHDGSLDFDLYQLHNDHRFLALLQSLEKAFESSEERMKAISKLVNVHTNTHTDQGAQAQGESVSQALQQWLEICLNLSYLDCFHSYTNSSSNTDDGSDCMNTNDSRGMDSSLDQIHHQVLDSITRILDSSCRVFSVHMDQCDYQQVYSLSLLFADVFDRRRRALLPRGRRRRVWEGRGARQGHGMHGGGVHESRGESHPSLHAGRDFSASDARIISLFEDKIAPHSLNLLRNFSSSALLQTAWAFSALPLNHGLCIYSDAESGDANGTGYGSGGKSGKRKGTDRAEARARAIISHYQNNHEDHNSPLKCTAAHPLSFHNIRRFLDCVAVEVIVSRLRTSSPHDLVRLVWTFGVYDMKGGNIETLLGTVSKILLDESKADSAVGSNVRNDNDSNDKKDGREMDFSADHLRSGASFSSVSQFHPYLCPQYQTEAAHRHPASDINGGGGSDRRGRGKEKEKDTANGASIESPGKGRGKGKVLKLHTLSTQELSQLVWTLGTLFSYPDQNQHYQPQPHLATASSVVPPFIIPRKVERLLEFLSTHVQADPFFSSSRRAPPLSACASPQTHTRASGEWQFCEVVDLLWGMSQIGLHTHHNTTQQEIDALFAASFPVVQAALSVDAHADAEAHTQAPMPFDHLEQDHQLLLALAQAYTNRERAHTHHYHRLQSARRYHNHPSVQQRYGRAEAEGERAEDVVQFRGEKQEVFELIARKLSFSASSLSSSTASPASHAVMEAPLSMFSDGDLSRVVALFGEHAVQSRNRQAQQDERKRSNDSPTGGALGTGKDHEQTEGNTDVSTGVACSEKQMDHSAVSRQPTEALFEAVARVIVSEGREELNQKQIRDIALGFNRMQLNHGKEGKAMLNYLSYLILYLPLKDNARPSLSSPSPSASAAYLHMHSGSGRTHGNQGHTDDGSGHDDQYSYQDANPEFARLIRNKQAFGAGWILLLALFYYRSFVYLTLKDENAERRKRLRNSMRVQRWQSLEQRER